MRIGLGMDFLKSVPGEGRREAWEIARALVSAGREHHFLAFLCRGEHSPLAAENLKLKKSLMAGGRVSRTLWENFVMPYRLFKNNVEIFLSLSGAFSRLSWTPVVLYLRDIFPLLYPTFFPKQSVSRMKVFMPRAVERARRIIVPSPRVRDDAQKYFKVDATKFEVVPPGISDCWREIKDKPPLRALREKYHLPQRFLLHVGRPAPLRNVETVIQGFFAACMNGELPQGLVLVSRPGKDKQRILRLLDSLRFRQRVNWIDNAPEEDLAGIVNLADAVIFLSMAEGHGSMVTRALACGTPVICSQDAALVEAAGDSALQIDPADLPSVRKAIEQMLGNQQFWEHWRDAARKHSRPPSWNETATKYLSILQSAHDEFYSSFKKP